MNFEQMVKKAVEVSTLKASIGVRYWEDGNVNGMDDSDDDPQMPMIKNGRWELSIDLMTGVIDGWPAGTVASVHYKVCDDGEYALLAEDGTEVARKEGYVPEMLAPSGNGYGDYVIMDIGPDGKISQWRPDLAYFQDGDQ